MLLNFDLNLGKFVLGPNTTAELTELIAKRSPSTEIQVRMLDGVTPVELASDASGIIEVKEVGEYDSAPLTAALAWVKTGTGIDTLYTFGLALINDPLDALLGVEAPAAITAINTGTNTLTSIAHGLALNDVIQFQTTDTLPGGLLANTDYFVISAGLTADDFRVSLTLGGAAVDITDSGTGTHYWTYAGNDIEDITLMFEMQITVGGRVKKSQRLDFILQNDIVRDGDVPPASPELLYGLFLPEIDTMADFKAVPTVGRRLNTIVEILIDYTGTDHWLTYRLEAGPATELEPAHVEPDDYDLSTNDVHWRGAVGPSGGRGLNAGIAYKWNTATSGNPGSGKLLASSGTFLSIVSINIHKSDDDGNAIAAALATWDDSTSAIKGRLIAVDPDDPTNFKIFDITGSMTDAGAYDTFSVSPVASGGAFTNGQSIRLTFIPKGDKGESGSTGFKFAFNSATSGDPAAGKFLFNNATYASATQWNVSETDGDTLSVASVLAAIDNGTSTNKCLVEIRKADRTAFRSFWITGTLTDPGAYNTFPITPIEGQGTINNGDVCYISFSPVADKGDTGTGGGIDILDQFFSDFSNAGTGSFESLYDFAVPAGTLAANGDQLRMKFDFRLVFHATAKRDFKISFGESDLGYALLETGPDFGSYDSYIFDNSTIIPSAFIEVIITRTGATTFLFEATLSVSPGPSTEPNTLVLVDNQTFGGLSFASDAITIELFGKAYATGAAAGDVTARRGCIEYIPAA